MTNKIFTIGLGLVLAATVLVPGVQAESLFRTGTSYMATQPYTPRSLYAAPRPQAVGDLVTIVIDEQTSVQQNEQLDLSRKAETDNNTTSVLNGVIKRITGFGSFLPEFDNIQNDSSTTSTAKSTRQNLYKDTVACQVVQVLPNGYLMIQGRKMLFANKERQELIVSGIVNPYYLDQQNQIASNQVGNFQMVVSGHGVLTRQQNDGIVNKVNQFLN